MPGPIPATADGMPAQVRAGEPTGTDPVETPFVQGSGDGDAIDANDVDQDGLNSCAVMSTIASIAEQNPDAIRNMIRDNGDGTYTVTFQRYEDGFLGIEALGGGWKEVEVTVSGPFTGNAADPGDQVDGQAEVWPAIIEKAYAEFRGQNYDSGENAGNVQAAILGRDPTRAPPSDYSAADINTRIAEGEAVTALTPNPDDWNADQRAIADAYGVAGWHWYRVEGTYVDENGVERIQLDNPWGKDDDVDMPYADYQQIFIEVDSTATR